MLIEFEENLEGEIGSISLVNSLEQMEIGSISLVNSMEVKIPDGSAIDIELLLVSAVKRASAENEVAKTSAEVVTEVFLEDLWRCFL